MGRKGQHDYHGQHADVLGAAAIYELNNFLARRKYGRTAQQEAPRSLAFATEWNWLIAALVLYLTCSVAW